MNLIKMKFFKKNAGQYIVSSDWENFPERVTERAMTLREEKSKASVRNFVTEKLKNRR